VTFQVRPAAYRQVAVDPERPVVARLVALAYRVAALAPDLLAHPQLAVHLVAAVAAQAAAAAIEQTQSMRSS
jgi:hypothetical protein